MNVTLVCRKCTSWTNRGWPSVRAYCPAIYQRFWAILIPLALATIPAIASYGEEAMAFRELKWKQHLVSSESPFSSCAVLDVNGDGHPDIYCGEFWYEGPTWRRHFTRHVSSIGGRKDDYSNLPIDINGDGRTDIVSVNYRSRSLFWVEQPLDLQQRWVTHLIDTPGPSETGRLVDLDADGRLDVLPNGTKTAAWYSFERLGRESVVEWQRHELPQELAGHGIGWGDLNGDGRLDLIGPNGWAEAPVDPRGGRWRWHAEFRLHPDASIPILVVDVDDDQDLDLVWGRAHQTGVYWLEQSQADGRRRWQQHTIDTDVSQCHSLLWLDLDKNGRHELVTGKRWLAHDGRDCGEWDPMFVVRYEWIPQRRSWTRQWLSRGGSCGIDLDVAAADLDHDNDLDLVVPSRVGLHWFENGGTLEKQSAAVPSQAVESIAMGENDRDGHSLLMWKKSGGDRQPIQDRSEWGQRRAQILQRMEQVMGPLPSPDQRVPLDVRHESEERLEKYTRIRLSYQMSEGERVPAYLLVPHDRSTPGPAMLCLHQTQNLGKGEVCALGGKPSMFYAHELAERGYVCLAPDYPSFGDYQCDFTGVGATKVSGTMKAIWGNIRGVDLLESLSEVDPDRMGCIGHSLGGHNGLFTAAFDQRLRAVVTSCGFTRFPNYYGGNLAGWTSPRYMPRIASVYQNDPKRMPFDFEEVLAALCPRSLFVNAPLNDDNFDVQGVRDVMTQVQELYRWYEMTPDRCVAVYPDAAHDFPEAIRTAAYEWLELQLAR